MSLRIAFDLDGVLADMESELVRQAEIVFGEPMTRKLQERAEAQGPQPATSPQSTDDDTTDASESRRTLPEIPSQAQRRPL